MAKPEAVADTLQSWRISATALACLMLGPSALMVSSFGVLQAPLSKTFGWGMGQIGFAVSLMAISIMIASPIQGLLVDRFGARRVVLTSIPCFALALAALYRMPGDIRVFYAAWAALPFFAIGLWPGAYLKVVSGWFDRRLGLATGVANAGIGIGTMILPPIIAGVIAQNGARAGFLAMAVAALAAWPVAFLYLREAPTPTENPAQPKPATWTYGEMFADPAFRCLMGGFLLLGVTGTGLVANLVPISVEAGASPAQAVATMTAFGVATLFGRLFTGWLLDRMHAFKVIVLLAGSTLIALLTIIAHPPAAVALSAATVLGLLSGGEFDVLAYCIRRYFGLSAFGKMYGVGFALFQMGAVAGAAILAASVGRTGSYTPALLALSAAVAVALLIFSRLPPYRRSDALDAPLPAIPSPGATGAPLTD